MDVTHKSILLALTVTVIVLVGFFNHDAFALDATTTTVTPNSATVNLGSQITFTVTVADNTNSSNTPTGTISLSDKNAHGTFSPTSCTLPSGGCTTSYTPAANASSAVTINATYMGDSTHSASSGTSSLTVNRFHYTTTTVTPNSATVNSGTQITFTATIADTSSSPTTPSGNVTWSDGNAHGTFSPTSCTLPSGGCTTSYTIATNPPTSVTVTASYSGDSTHSGSAGASSLSVIILHSTTVTIIPNPATLSFAGTAKFIVKVNDSSSSPTTPIGTVSWTDNHAGGVFNVTSCTLSSGSCASMYTASGNPPNVITINATYSGDNTHSSGWATSSLSTNTIYSTTTTVTPNPATFTKGSSVAFTAVVTDTTNSSAALIGIVSWSDYGVGGTFSPNGCTLSNNRCSLTYTPPSNAPNSITIAASYVGDSHHSGSSGASSLSLAAPPAQPAQPTPTPPTQPTSPPAGQNNSKGSGVPEFPIAMTSILAAGFGILLIYQKVRGILK